MKDHESRARTEAAGALFIVLTGTPLHFLYSATGWAFLSWLGPINESTWEHFKLAFWPGLVWSTWQWIRLPSHRQTIWTAKAVSLVATPCAIAVIFYGYTSLLGHNVLALDIGTFIAAVGLGQYLGYRTWIRNRAWPLAPWVVASLTAAFIYFSYAPPSFFLFSDPRVAGQ